jgi:hypothetical protein
VIAEERIGRIVYLESPLTKSPDPSTHSKERG